MQVRDSMSGFCEFIKPDTTVEEAARKMKELDCGFLPIGNKEKGKLEGVATDRDIVLRVVAAGKNPQQTTIQECASPQVLYCYETDNLDDAAHHMRQLQVHRLIVLDNAEDKRLRGVISLGDISRRGKPDLARTALEGITRKAA